MIRVAQGAHLARRMRLGAGIAALVLALAACSGGGSSASSGTGGSGGTNPPPPTIPPPPPPPPPVTQIGNAEKAAHFLTLATFGATIEEIRALEGGSASNWMKSQIALPASQILPGLLTRWPAGTSPANRAHTLAYWEVLIDGQDTLRQRATFALSQIVVASDASGNPDPREMAYFADVLSRNALGNYRELLQEVTYSPAMGRWLTYVNNQKADPKTGRMPDENYARELLQLFTIGLVELNRDGTPRLVNGNPVETYDNDDIVGLARVFTGFVLKGDEAGPPTADAVWSPMEIDSRKFEPGEKAFLGLTIPAGRTQDESVRLAIDHIFAHPNVGPFVSRQLIQRMTQSNPSPAYVERVATAFESGRFVAADGVRFGDGRRGSLEATFAAILLDPEALNRTGTPPSGSGKIREPALQFVQWTRAFNVNVVDIFNETRLRNDGNGLNQRPFGAPSVFNFYRPGYIAPGTATGIAGLTAPEFQNVNEIAVIDLGNFMTGYNFDRFSGADASINSMVTDYAREAALANDPAALVDHLDLLLTAGRLTDTTRAEIVGTVGLLPLATATDAADRLRRVRLAVGMVMATPEFTIVY